MIEGAVDGVEVVGGWAVTVVSWACAVVSIGLWLVIYVTVVPNTIVVVDDPVAVGADP